MDRTAVVLDPIQQLLRDGRRDGRSLSLALALGIAAHLGVGILVPRWAHAPIASTRVVPPSEIVEIEPPPPPPPPVPTQEPPPPAPTEAPRAKAPEPAPPPLAQAAAVVTRKESPAEPADFSESMVVGSGTTYVGGTTAAAGTGLRAEHTAGGPPGGAPAAAAPAATGPDRSRKAKRKDEAEWKCPFPSEADTASVDNAIVGLRIDVGADGAPSNVTVVRDPGHGFGREARRCALDKRWEPALDHEGSPIASSVSINVHFDR